MAFKDYKEFVAPLTLPIMGKEYVIQPVSAKLGAKLMLSVERAQEIMRVMDENERAESEALAKGETPPEPQPIPDFEFEDGENEEELYKEILGKETIALMESDNVPYSSIRLAGLTGYHDFLYGREAAEAFWNSGGDPKALAENLAGIQESTVSTTSTDEETTTKKPASTSGTKSRKKK